MKCQPKNRIKMAVVSSGISVITHYRVLEKIRGVIVYCRLAERF